MRRALVVLLVVLALLTPTVALAAHRTAYPHVGEDDRFADTDPYLGRTTHRQPIFMVGDSITQRSMPALRRQGIRWEISAVPGRDVGNLPYYVHDRRRAAPFLNTLVIALGTNGTLGWTYDDLLAVVRSVAVNTKVVLMTTWRDPRRNPETSSYRNRASTQTTYSSWMRRIATVRPRTCLADWRSYVSAHPSAAPDGVHPYYGSRRAWAAIIMRAVSRCR